MSAVLLKAIELHRTHRAIPLWQCIALARDLEGEPPPAGREPVGEEPRISARRRLTGQRARPLAGRGSGRAR